MAPVFRRLEGSGPLRPPIRCPNRNLKFQRIIFLRFSKLSPQTDYPSAGGLTAFTENALVKLSRRGTR
jgi:hypothetical protein